jgi:hypothetical protein
MPHIRKPPVSGPAIDWGPWSAARFQTEAARDGFVCSVANAQLDGCDAQVMPEDGLGAQVRWRPGRFLGLNDVAYAHGGRIVMRRSGPAGVTDRTAALSTCPWCKGCRLCALCDGTGKSFVPTRILQLTHVADCRACDGTAVCQLCKGAGLRPGSP